VIGAVFLIVGIQGTRLIRFTSGSNIVELEEKKRILADAIEKAQDEGNIQKASGIVEGAAIAAPALGLAKNVGLQYELQVASAIVGMGYHATPSSSLDRGFDLIVADGNDRVILAELKRLSRPVPRQAVDALLYRTFTRRAPVVLITYTELSRAAQEVVNASGNLEVVQWRDEDDNDRLAETLRRMFASISK
jgi:Restriction endonuclease